MYVWEQSPGIFSYQNYTYELFFIQQSYCFRKVAENRRSKPKPKPKPAKQYMEYYDDYYYDEPPSYKRAGHEGRSRVFYISS